VFLCVLYVLFWGVWGEGEERGGGGGGGGVVDCPYCNSVGNAGGAGRMKGRLIHVQTTRSETISCRGQRSLPY